MRRIIINPHSPSLTETERRVLISLHLRGTMGDMGSMTLPKRRKLLQDLVKRGLITDRLAVTQKGLQEIQQKSNPAKWLVYEKGKPENFTALLTEESAEKMKDRLNKTAGYEKFEVIGYLHYKDRIENPEKLKSKNLGFAYEVSFKNRVFRVRYEHDGENKGLWTVKEQQLKDEGINHWFLVAVESSKKDALRLIEDESYPVE